MSDLGVPLPETEAEEMQNRIAALEAENEELKDQLEYATESSAELGRALKQTQQERDALQAENEKLKQGEKYLTESLEAQEAKFSGCPHKSIEDSLCGCSYDRLGDVCAFHAPALRKAQEERDALQAENERLKAPLSDELIHEFYSYECEAGVSFDFLRRFQKFIAARASQKEQ